MSATWMTKYGPRRVRVDPPTLEDALYAAEGLTPDRHEQIRIAADLMQLPVEEASAQAQRIMKSRSKLASTVRNSRSLSPVVVERRGSRRRHA